MSYEQKHFQSIILSLTQCIEAHYHGIEHRKQMGKAIKATTMITAELKNFGLV